MSSFGEESKVLADTERIQKTLEDEPSMELMFILLEKLDELQRKAERLDLFNMERAIDEIMPSRVRSRGQRQLVASFSGRWQTASPSVRSSCRSRAAPHGRTHQPPRSRRHPVARGVSGSRRRADGDCLARSRIPRPAVHKTVEVERGRATTYKGNFSDYQRQKASGSAQQMVAYEKYMKEVARQKEMIRRLSGGGQSVAPTPQRGTQRLEEDPVEKPLVGEDATIQFPDAPRSSAVVARVENLTECDEKPLQEHQPPDRQGRARGC